MISSHSSTLLKPTPANAPTTPISHYSPAYFPLHFSSMRTYTRYNAGNINNNAGSCNPIRKQNERPNYKGNLSLQPVKRLYSSSLLLGHISNSIKLAKRFAHSHSLNTITTSSSSDLAPESTLTDNNNNNNHHNSSKNNNNSTIIDEAEFNRIMVDQLQVLPYSPKETNPRAIGKRFSDDNSRVFWKLDKYSSNIN